MGVSISWFLSVLNKMMVHQFYTLPETMKTFLLPSILERDGGEDSRTMKLQTKKPFLKTSTTTVNSLVTDKNKGEAANLDFEAATLLSPKELDVAAIKVQKVYKSYRTRRNLADSLEFDSSAASRWAHATTRAALVGKGLSKDKKAQKLALQHWLEAIDPRHRYGHNLRLYYDIWYGSKSTQPFFYWLDVGDGKELNLEGCPRINLQSQCVKYLGLKEREAYEVIVQNGKLLYKQSRLPLNTDGDSKWIFVLSTSRALYVGQKIKGVFHHSSFLSGGAATAAGRLFASHGILKAVWPYSGHYLPTEDNFMEFINFLEEHHVDLSNVERCTVDGDTIS